MGYRSTYVVYPGSYQLILRFFFSYIFLPFVPFKLVVTSNLKFIRFQAILEMHLKAL